jgi:adenosylcobinamide hydrolase
MMSSAVLGGGTGERRWWLNTQVPLAYGRTDPARHVEEIATALGLDGPGVGLLTAADVRHVTAASDGGVDVVATVGLGLPVRAAAPESSIGAETAATAWSRAAYVPGTINVLVVVPVPLSDAALVNTVITMTEAKTQALAEAGVPGTGTSSDAVCVACPIAAPGALTAPAGLPTGSSPEAVEPFAGPRSTWGARVARAVHRAVAEGTAGWLARHEPGDRFSGR